MKSTERFLSADGRTQILSYWYVPENPKAVVRLCHGMSEHIGRDGYDEFASFLEFHGYAVCAHDYIGHGGSAAAEDLGYFGDSGGCVYLIKDVETLGKLASERFPGRKHALFGHSMGSLIARQYIAEHSGENSCVGIMGTLGPLPAAPIALGLAKAITAVQGKRARSDILHGMSFGSYLNRIKDPVSKNDWLSTVQSEVEKYDNDPLCGFRFTNAAMCDLITIYAEVSKKDWARKLDKDVPLLFLSGSEDPCGGYGKGVEEIYMRVKAAGVPAEIKMFDDVRHELLNETCKTEVYQSILDFLNANL